MRATEFVPPPEPVPPPTSSADPTTVADVVDSSPASTTSPAATPSPSVSVSTRYVPMPVPVGRELNQLCVIGRPAARMRSGPGSDYTQVARILYGDCDVYDAGKITGYDDAVLRYGEAPDGSTVLWRFVSYHGTTGWIIDSFLS